MSDDAPSGPQGLTPSGDQQPVSQDQPQAAPARQDRPPPAPPAAEQPDAATLICRYGLMRQVGEFRHNLDPTPRIGAKVVVRTERGVEIAEVLLHVRDSLEEASCQTCGMAKADGLAPVLDGASVWAAGCRSMSRARLKEFLATTGPDYPFGRGQVLRLANHQDLVDQRHLESGAQEEGAFCRQQIRELGLGMRLVTVEHLLGGERIIFYFSSENRVDFRELVRRMAGQYRTRIEMRQVGARDEARLVADFERCGQQCCCQRLLKDLKPVSMRMAKMQKATLDPSKISGRCGRLMCCLRYEDAGYEELRKLLPRKNTWVRTERVLGRVIDTQIITQLVRLELVDNTQVVVPSDEIIERNVPAPNLPSPEEDRRPREKPIPRMLRDEVRPAFSAEVEDRGLADDAQDKQEAIATPADDVAPDVEDAFDGRRPGKPTPQTAEPLVPDRPDEEVEPDSDSEGPEQPEDQRRQISPVQAGGDQARPDGRDQGGQGQQRRRRRRRRRHHGRGGGGGPGPVGGNPNRPPGPQQSSPPGGRSPSAPPGGQPQG